MVSALQPATSDAVGLAALLEAFLASYLERDPAMRVVRVEDTPDFPDYDARVWIDSCPKGQVSGCTLVLAERAKARWAVTGTVDVAGAGSRVTVEIVDVDAARVALTFVSELEAGSDEVFAEGVAKLLVSAMAGAFAERDIRSSDEGGDEAPKVDPEVARRQLEALSRELGDITTFVTASDRPIRRATYTTTDLAKDDVEGAAPWDRLDMSAEEYLRYKNSGLELMEWRARAVGKHGQLLIRPFGGFRSGPWSGQYYGRYAIDGQQIVDTLSVQAVQSNGGAVIGGSVAYGVTPWLDVGLVVGMATGTYSVDVDQQVVGQPDGVVEPVQDQNFPVFLGPRAVATFLPAKSVRPVAGLGVVVVRASGVAEHLELPEYLTVWPSSWLVAGELLIGGEARLSRALDLYVHLPIDIVVAGDLRQVDRQTLVAAITEYTPPAASTVGFGAELGLQVRLFGRKAKQGGRYDELEVDDAP